MPVVPTATSEALRRERTTASTAGDAGSPGHTAANQTASGGTIACAGRVIYGRSTSRAPRGACATIAHANTCPGSRDYTPGGEGAGSIATSGDNGDVAGNAPARAACAIADIDRRTFAAGGSSALAQTNTDQTLPRLRRSTRHLRNLEETPRLMETGQPREQVARAWAPCPVQKRG